MDRRRAAGTLLALAACVACATAAPTTSDQTALDLYEGGAASEGCYYNFQHYGEGDRIMTNEPCLNCTCHNRMLMCYLRVCPFTKPIGQDCTVEKRADQCCPIVTCPDVPVDLLTSTSTTSPAEYGATGVGHLDKYGCNINGKFLPEGAKVPAAPNKPCEHCYCIRNMTTCVMQECTLHVDGCTPIYHKDVCCPVRYSCDHAEDEIPLLDDMTTTVRPTPGFLLTTTNIPSVTQDCIHDDQVYADGASIKTEKACEHCYCMKGDIVCVVQECGTPMENEGKNCTSSPPREGQCCPDTYICEGDNELPSDELSTTVPPRRSFVEGSGYRIEPDEINTVVPTLETEQEGSGQEEVTEKSATESADVPLVEDTYSTAIPKTAEETPAEFSPAAVEITTSEPDKGENTVPTDMFDETTKPPQRSGDVTTVSAETESSQSVTPKQESSTQAEEVFTPGGSLEDKFGVPSTESPLQQPTTPSISISDESSITTELPLTFGPSEQEEPLTITTAAVKLEEPEDITTSRPETEISQAVTKADEKEEPQTNVAVTAGIEENEPQTSTTTTVESDSSQTTSAPLQEQEEPQGTTSSPEEPQPTTTPSVEREGFQTTPATLLEEEEPQATTAAPLEKEQPQITTTLPVERDGSQTTTAPSSEEHETQATTSGSVEREESERTTLTAVETDVSQTTTAPLLEESQATTAAPQNADEPQVSTLPSVEKEGFQTTPVVLLEEEQSQLTTAALLEKEQPQATTTPPVERDGSQTTTAPLLEEQEPQATTSPSVEKEPQPTTSTSADRDISQTTIAPLQEEEESQGTTTPKVDKEEATTIAPIEKEGSQTSTSPSYEKQESQATTSAPIEKDGSQSTTASLLEEQEPQATTVASVDVEEPLPTTTASIDKDESQTTTTPLIEKLEPQVTSSAPVEKDGSPTTTASLLEEQEPQVTTVASVDVEEPQLTTTASIEKDESQTTTTPLLEELEPQATTLAPIERDGSQTTSIPLLEEQEPRVTTTSSIEKETTKDSPTTEIEHEEPAIVVTTDVEKEEPQPTASSVPLEDQATTVEPDVAETTSVNPSENEIHIESTPASSPGVIPGEGNCLINGVTYVNDTKVPSLNKCESSCKCVSSIVKCDPVICSPPPLNMMKMNCRPVQDNEETCCPIYVCDDGKETIPPQSHSQMAGTDKPIILCDNDECKTPETTQPITEIPACVSGDCSPTNDGKDVSDCGSAGCGITESADRPMPESGDKQPEVCLDGNCLSPPQICDGDLCSQPATPTKPCDKEDGCATETPTQQSCDGVPCVSDITTTKSVCVGEECDNVASPVVPSAPCTGKSCGETTPEISLTTESTDKESCSEGSDCQKATTQPLAEVECTDDTCTRKDVNELGNKFGPGCEGSECTQSEVKPSTDAGPLVTQQPETDITAGAEPSISSEKEDAAVVPSETTTAESVTQPSESASTTAMDTTVKVTETPAEPDRSITEKSQEQTEQPSAQFTTDMVPETTEPSEGFTEKETEQELSVTTPAEGYIYAKPTGADESYTEQDVTTKAKLPEEVTTKSSEIQETVTDTSSSPMPDESPITDSGVSLPVSVEGELSQPEESTSTPSPQILTESEKVTPKIDEMSVTAATDKEVQDITSTTDAMIRDEMFTKKSIEEPSSSDETTTKATSYELNEGINTEGPTLIETVEESGTTEKEHMPQQEMDTITTEIPEIYTSGLPEVTATFAPIQPSDISSTTQAQLDTSPEKDESTSSESSTTPSDKFDQTIPTEGVMKDESLSTTPSSEAIDLTEGPINETSTHQPSTIEDREKTPTATESSEVKPELPETDQNLTEIPETEVTKVDNIVTDASVEDHDRTTESSLTSVEPHGTGEPPMAPPAEDHKLQTGAPEITEPQQTEKPSEEPQPAVELQTESPAMQEQPEFNDTRRFESAPGVSTLEPEYIAVPISSEIPVSLSEETSTENVPDFTTKSIPVTEISTSAPKEPISPTQVIEPAEDEAIRTEIPPSEIPEGQEVETRPPEPAIDQEVETTVAAVTVSQETSTEPQSFTEKIEGPTEGPVADTTEFIPEHSETTPYLVELEVHTHKTDDFITPETTDSQTTSAPLTEIETSSYGERKTTIPETESSQTTISSPLPTEMGDLGSKFGKPEEIPAEIPATEISVDTTEANIAATDKETELSSTSAPEVDMSKINAPSTERPETTSELIPQVDIATTPAQIADEITQAPIEETTRTETKGTEPAFTTSSPDLTKPSTSDELPLPEEEASQFPPSAGPGGYGEPDYVEEDQSFGPGTCRYGGKVYVSAQQIPRDDPCDFCFCFRSDIICLQQSCPPPIHGCHEEPIQGFCCPRYECPVSMATTMNVTTTTTTTTTTLPPHFLPHAYKGQAQRKGCQIKGQTYKVGEVVRASSGPCLTCTCGGDGQMKCDPKQCTPEPMLRQMIAAAVSSKRRR